MLSLKRRKTRSIIKKRENLGKYAYAGWEEGMNMGLQIQKYLGTKSVVSSHLCFWPISCSWLMCIPVRPLILRTKSSAKINIPLSVPSENYP